MLLFIYLAGIEPHGNMVKQPAIFTVDTISAGQGDLMVFVEDPEGNREEVCMLKILWGKHKASQNTGDFVVTVVFHEISNLEKLQNTVYQKCKLQAFPHNCLTR